MRFGMTTRKIDTAAEESGKMQVQMVDALEAAA
jgi:hypothetical protein